jgi:hypothetical protein
MDERVVDGVGVRLAAADVDGSGDGGATDGAGSGDGAGSVDGRGASLGLGAPDDTLVCERDGVGYLYTTLR